MNIIKFYRVNDQHGYMSNFFHAPLMVDGKMWYHSEGYFQAMKFLDESIRERIRGMKSPSEAAKEGRKRSNPLRSDWESVKNDVMRKAIAAKFDQHPDLKKALLSTGSAFLVEHTTNDRYWADGGVCNVLSDGSLSLGGGNWLGKILMEYRDAHLSK